MSEPVYKLLFSLLDSQRDLLRKHLTTDARLDWFGEVVLGREAIIRFIDSELPETIHVFTSSTNPVTILDLNGGPLASEGLINGRPDLVAYKEGTWESLSVVAILKMERRFPQLERGLHSLKRAATTRWRRSITVKMIFSCSEQQHIYFSSLSYRDTGRCRRNLTAEFDRLEPQPKRLTL